jgi:prolyl oligopeptidase
MMAVRAVPPMTRARDIVALTFMLAGFAASAACAGRPADSTMSTSRLIYPPARKADVVDDYHGVKVADPYRWLEEADSAETVAWVNAENALMQSFVDRPTREAVRSRLTDLFNYPRTAVPMKRGHRYFVSRNTGLQDQAVLDVQDGLTGQPRTLLDPNRLSPDGTVALTAIAIDDRGTRLAYGLSQSGSDRQDLYVRDVATLQDRPDRIRWAKFASISWLKDGSGFYYTRFPEPGSVPAGDENYHNRVYFHRLGDDQAKDPLVFARPDDREIVFSTALTEDDGQLVITAFKGASDNSEVYVLDRREPGALPVPLFRGFGSSYQFIDESGGSLFFQTNADAPLGRVIAVDRHDLSRQAVEVVAQGPDKLSHSAIVNDHLVLAYLHNASDQVRLIGLDGRATGAIPLPAIGSVTELSGRPKDDELFLGFASFTHPPTVYRYDFKTRTLSEFDKTTPKIEPSAYDVRQVWYPSRDGTQISMFLVHGRDLALDGQRPVLLTGYGGFNISLTPAFDPAIFAWLDKGGVYAVANLRGGGEYGEAWHQAGMLERKQHVFDDFIAAGEWLITNGYTNSRKLAIEGASNGGLLVGAVLLQRPDLWGAAVCRVPVADMLRYHRFTVGRYWIPEYGSSDDPAQFKVLIGYSPLHNVQDGMAYPPTLVMTADTDDRVFPGMAKKFAARLQAAASGASPILIRVETKAGHGAGKPVSKVIDEDADIYGFLFRVLGIE